MTSRPFALATLLMVSAALAAAPGLAATWSAGNPGSDADVVLGAPVTLPPGTAMPMGPLDAAMQKKPMPRPDLEKLYKAYATVAHGADGTTRVIPASPKLRAIIDEEFGSGSDD